MLQKVISGGQTGVDRAALDAAIQLEIPYGGWCPKGRIDELGIIPTRYSNLEEIFGNFKSEKENYDARTKENIKDSDGTLILVPTNPLPPELKDGTLLTIKEVEKQNKPHLTIALSASLQENIESILTWIKQHHIETLNIAGPRETSCPGIYAASLSLIENTLLLVKNHHLQRPKL